MKACRAFPHALASGNRTVRLVVGRRDSKSMRALGALLWTNPFSPEVHKQHDGTMQDTLKK